MSLWTLVYDGTEKALADWGITADVEREETNKQKGRFRCRTVEAFDAGAPQFAYREPMTVWRDRTAIGAGGTVWFRGYWSDGKRVADGGREHIEYEAYDVWWLFERQVFMQKRRQFSGTDTHVPTGTYVYEDVMGPEVYLGELLTALSTLSLQTNGEQIGEVVAWMNECFNPTKRGATVGRDDGQDVVQIGTVDTQSIIPVERASGIYCSEAIIRVLRLSPDAIVRMDLSTTPPTLQVRTFAKWNYTTSPPTFVDYTNLSEVTVDITADQEKQIGLQARHDNQLNGVAIYYRWVTSVDGVQSPRMAVDKFPATITDYTPEVSRHLIDLAGSSMNTVQAQVSVNRDHPISWTVGSDVEKKAWWLAHDNTLTDPAIDQASIVIQDATISDTLGCAVSLVLTPNELDEGTTVPKWTGCLQNRVLVKARMAFVRYADKAHLIIDTKATSRTVSQTLTLTNAESREYSAVTSYDPGESAPEGVAEQAYRGLDALQHAAGITFTKAQLRSDIYVGCRLKLVGPTTTFTNIVVQSVRERPHYGETVVNGGPMSAVDIDALITLARATRWRTTYSMPSHRADGAAGSSAGNVDASASTAARNTAHNVGGNSFYGATFDRTV